MSETQELLFASTRPKAELYDLTEDPFEARNLANDPKRQAQLGKLRKRLDDWINRAKERGPESEAVYDRNIAAYAKSPNADRQQARISSRNLALMKRWAAEGRLRVPTARIHGVGQPRWRRVSIIRTSGDSLESVSPCRAAWRSQDSWRSASARSVDGTVPAYQSGPGRSGT